MTVFLLFESKAADRSVRTTQSQYKVRGPCGRVFFLRHILIWGIGDGELWLRILVAGSRGARNAGSGRNSVLWRGRRGTGCGCRSLMGIRLVTMWGWSGWL